MPRYLHSHITRDLKRKMVLIAGPRQVGKTTCALELLGADAAHPGYLNWDYADDRSLLLSGKLPAETPLLVLDEIHQYPRWREFIKGIYDKQRSRRSILVTGSARLDFFSKGGDSLSGRYYLYRLHPFSLVEMNPQPNADDLQNLLCFGGFPEPLFAQSESEWKRWQRQRQHTVIKEDIVSLQPVRELGALETLVALLPARIGSPLSLNALSSQLSASFASVDRWLRILENLYFGFRIAPFTVRATRSLKKEKKFYFWDWSQCPPGGARLENFVAAQLLKYCHHREDTEGDTMQLCYLRDQQKREIDFVVTCNQQPLFAVECKSSDSDIQPAIKYYSARANIPIYYQLHLGKADYELITYKARIMPLSKFCVEVLQV